MSIAYLVVLLMIQEAIYNERHWTSAFPCCSSKEQILLVPDKEEDQDENTEVVEEKQRVDRIDDRVIDEVILNLVTIIII